MVVDRGQGEPDDPRFDTEASIFSGCGAALFLRRSMLEDIATEGEYFAEAFFAYKEDVDLGWRARLRGWDVRYVPDAVAWHVRALPLERGAWRRMPLLARRHSWKNHYVLMLRNDRLTDILRDLPFIAGWELLRVGHSLLRDPRVLPALLDTFRQIRPALEARRQVAARRLIPARQLRRWFGGQPIPVPSSVPARQAADAARVSA
jgi:GT2 family glycosyltransferase